MNCSLSRLAFHAYLDGELGPADTLNLEAHLLQCAVCRRECEELLATAETVRGARGVYQVPERSLARARERVARYGRGLAFRSYAVAAALAIGVATLAAVHLSSRPDMLSELAAQSHLRYTAGELPLDIRSAKARDVAQWLTARLPFALRLPDNPAPEGRNGEYQLEGARLLEPAPQNVAYIAYRVNGRPVSLVMTSGSGAVSSGGEVRHAGRLEFHRKLIEGLRVVTWADRGVRYALVSQKEAGGPESCVVCHSGDPAKFRLRL